MAHTKICHYHQFIIGSMWAFLTNSSKVTHRRYHTSNIVNQVHLYRQKSHSNQRYAGQTYSSLLAFTWQRCTAFTWELRKRNGPPFLGVHFLSCFYWTAFKILIHIFTIYSNHFDGNRWIRKHRWSTSTMVP